VIEPPPASALPALRNGDVAVIPSETEGNSISSRQLVNARLDQVTQDMPLDASVLAWMQFLFGVALTVY